MFKKLKNILYIMIILLLLFSTKIDAHNRNITGYNKKDSTEISEYNGKYYGYHNEDGTRHYHQVEWDEEEKKWIIINPAVYYDEKFNIIDIYENENTTRIELEFCEAVDGDTAKFNLNNEIITVRFLGIDTPETVHTQKEEQPYGQEASNYTKTRLENGDKIELEYDSNSLEKDKYGRVLVWIWIDDSLLQEELVKNGLARTYMLQDNYRYAGRLQLAEEEAKNNHINIWNENNDTEEIKKDNYIQIIILIIVLIIILVIITIRKFEKKRK